jgi:beta-N-acetylhexosaminidase
LLGLFAAFTSIPKPPLGLSPEQTAMKRMIGQMLVIGFPGTSLEQVWPSRVADMIAKGEIGGVILLSDNIVSPEQLRRLTAALIKAGGALKPFIAVDQEGGAVQRLTRYKGFQGLPSAETVALGNVSAAFQTYARQAQELAALGITVNLGPVVDLNVAADNPIIGALGRSYGPSAEAVLPFARAFIAAHSQRGILTAAKHFPGHGSSTTDPHFEIADVNGDWLQQELDPFKTLAAGEGSVPMMMIGHLIVEGFSDGDAPASLSRKAVTGILRKQWKYEGLAVTDDLDMAAVRNRYGVEEAFVRAVAAGNDLILAANHRSPDPTLVERGTQAILAAVHAGKIDRAQIRKSYERILAAKRRLAENKDCLSIKPLPLVAWPPRSNWQEHERPSH